MPLTKSFRDTVHARATADPAFRAGLHQEGVRSILDGDLPTGRILLRDLINATIGFPALAGQIGLSDKSLMRMFGADGNPHIANLAAVLEVMKAECGLTLTVRARQARRGRGIKVAA
jgi:DNA-binding phage protein